MKKWRYALLPAFGFLIVYVSERTGFVRYGPDNPAVPADEVDWSSVFTIWLIGMAIYFSQEIFRCHRKGRRNDQTS